MTDQQVTKPKSNHFKNHTLKEETEIVPTATWVHAFLLGVAMKIGGCTSGWHYGFAVGFREYVIAVVIMGLAYLCLGLCMSEMISIMSFSGGYYGYARCSIGPFAGFIVGCCGIFESTFSMCLSVIKVGIFVTEVFGSSKTYEPIWWTIYFGFVIGCHYFGRNYFWQWISILSVGTLLLVFIPLCGTMPDLDFDRYVAAYEKDHTALEFFAVFRLSVLFFMGFDMLTMTSAEVINPRISVPRAMTNLIGFLLVFALWLMFTVASQYPGVTKQLFGVTNVFTFLYQYEHLFGLSKRMALCVCVIPTLVTPLAYMYVVGRQVNSMAKSGLLPVIFKHTVGETRTPIMGMLYVVVLGTGGMLYAWEINPYTTMSRFSTLAGCIVYFAMFVCYIIFNTRFSNLERTFRNPLGIPSAVIGMSVFAIIFLIMIFIDTDFYQVTVIFFGFLFLKTVYYYAYAENHQFFSASEQKVFFKAYIVNMKRRKKQNFVQRIFMDIWKIVNIFGPRGTIRSRVYASTSGSELNSNSRVSDNCESNNFSEEHSASCSANPNVIGSTTVGSSSRKEGDLGGGIFGLLLGGSSKFSSQKMNKPVIASEVPMSDMENGEVLVKKDLEASTGRANEDDEADDHDDHEAEAEAEAEAAEGGPSIAGFLANAFGTSSKQIPIPVPPPPTSGEKQLP